MDTPRSRRVVWSNTTKIWRDVEKIRRMYRKLDPRVHLSWLNSQWCDMTESGFGPTWLAQGVPGMPLGSLWMDSSLMALRHTVYLRRHLWVDRALSAEWLRVVNKSGMGQTHDHWPPPYCPSGRQGSSNESCVTGESWLSMSSATIIVTRHHIRSSDIQAHSCYGCYWHDIADWRLFKHSDGLKRLTRWVCSAVMHECTWQGDETGVEKRTGDSQWKKGADHDMYFDKTPHRLWTE